MFGTKRVQVTGGWRKLCNEELCNSYSMLDVIRKSKSMRWTGHVTCMEKEKCIQSFDSKPEEKKQLGRIDYFNNGSGVEG